MSFHKGQIDQVHQIELTSAIQYTLWNKNVSAPRGSVGLVTFTHFVGDGAKIEIQIEDESGKKFEKYSDRIFGNRFWATIQVPEKARDALYATVKLPQLGLEMKSQPLLLLPPVEITNAKWDKQEARRGDILKLTADISEVPDGAEAKIEIWEHDADGAHDFITEFAALVESGKIEAEWEFEYHEDVDDIPTHEESENGYQHPEYFFRVRIAGVYADSGLLKFQDWIEIELTDHIGSSHSGEEYILLLPNGQERRGNLDGQGKIKEKNIPPGPYEIDFPNLNT